MSSPDRDDRLSKGTTNICKIVILERRSFAPWGAFRPIRRSIPPINRWAIIACPEGTKSTRLRSRRNESSGFYPLKKVARSLPQWDQRLCIFAAETRFQIEFLWLSSCRRSIESRPPSRQAGMRASFNGLSFVGFCCGSDWGKPNGNQEKQVEHFCWRNDFC